MVVKVKIRYGGVVTCRVRERGGLRIIKSEQYPRVSTLVSRGGTTIGS